MGQRSITDSFELAYKWGMAGIVANVVNNTDVTPIEVIQNPKAGVIYLIIIMIPAYIAFISIGAGIDQLVYYVFGDLLDTDDQ